MSRTFDDKVEARVARQQRRAAIRQAKKDLRAAQRALDANDARERARGIDYETPTYWRLNDAVGTARDQLKLARRRNWRRS